MTTPASSLGMATAQAAPEEQLPVPEAEERKASRRKKALLLLLLILMALLTLLTIWYLLFRKPITELPIPVGPAPMPAYQASLYDLSKPKNVAVTPDGSRIVVTQTGTSLDTVMIDRSGNRLAVLKPPSNLIQQAHQMFVAFDPATSQFWTTDRYNGVVAVYDSSGAFVRLFDQGTALANWQPLGIGFDASGNLYVADVSDTPVVIRVFGTDGKAVRTFGASAAMNHPNGILVAADGTVYVNDTGNGQLLVFDASGQRIGTVARGVGEGNLGLPVGIALDDHGQILVVDSAGGRVQAYAPIVPGEVGPRYINGFGAPGSGDAAFSYPNGLAADDRGRVYVADWGNDRLEIWSY